MTIEERIAQKIAEKKKARGEEAKPVEITNYDGSSLKGKAGSGK